MKLFSNFLRKRKIRTQFENQCSVDLIKKLQQNLSVVNLHGDIRPITVICCDVSKFSEEFEPHKHNVISIVSFMRRFRTAETDIVLKHQGFLGKHTSSGIVAFWNAPLDIKDYHEQAVKSSLEIIKSQTSLNQNKLLPLGISIGISTGDAIVGNTAQFGKFDYNCVGRPVNLSCELANQTRNYGVNIILDEETVSGLDKTWVVVELDVIFVPNMNTNIRIYTVLCQYIMESPQTVVISKTVHAKFLNAYREQRWEMAMTIASNLKLSWNGQLSNYYSIMIEKCRKLKNNIPMESNKDYII